MNERVSVLDDSRCDLHYTKFVENSERTRTIRKAIEGFEVIDHIEPIALNHPALLKVHKPKYIEKIVNSCKSEEVKLLEMDVMVYGQDSLNVIRIAAHSGIIAVDMPGNVFCNVRPPGHHAESGKAKGFCIFNNIESFKPDIILISCGFDAHTLDPLSNLNLSSKMYGWMTRELKKLCPKIVSILEGGYNLIALEESVREHLKNL